MKVAGSDTGTVQVKFIGGGADSVAEVSLATYAGVVDEGSGGMKLRFHTLSSLILS